MILCEVKFCLVKKQPKYAVALTHIKDPQGKPLKAGTAVKVYTTNGAEKSVLGSGGLLYLSTTSQSFKVVVLTGSQKGETIEGHYTPSKDMVVHLNKLAITYAPKVKLTAPNNMAITASQVGDRKVPHTSYQHEALRAGKQHLANKISTELMEYRNANYVSEQAGYFEETFGKYQSYFVGTQYISTQIISDSTHNT